MGLGPVARVGDFVYFPECGKYPIFSGGPLWFDSYRPLAHMFDGIACPGGAAIITGSLTFVDTFRPVARLGDIAYGPACQFGIIVSGSMRFLQGP
jgi:hypothetical protein